MVFTFITLALKWTNRNSAIALFYVHEFKKTKLQIIVKCDFLSITESFLAFVYAEIYDKENFFLTKKYHENAIMYKFAFTNEVPGVNFKIYF